MSAELITDIIGITLCVIGGSILVPLLITTIKEDYKDFKNKLKELRRDKSS